MNNEDVQNHDFMSGVEDTHTNVLENDGINFESNVLAEERIKAQGLQKLKVARSKSENEFSNTLSSSSYDSSSDLVQVKEETREELDEEKLGNDVQQEFFKTLVSYPESTDFQRVLITKTDRPVEPDTAAASTILLECMELRHKWINAHPFPPQDRENNIMSTVSTPDTLRRKAHGGNEHDVYRRRRDLVYDVFATPILPSVAHKYSTEMRQGVIQVMNIENVPVLIPPGAPRPETDKPANSNPTREPVFSVLPFEEFIRDMQTVKKGVFFGPTGSYSYHCLEVLSAKFNLHILLNATIETEAQKLVPHRDFYNIRKVDTHVHHSACMNQKHLLRFIKNKLKTCPNEVVIFRDGKFLTLGEVFKSLHLTAYDLSVDTLDMHASNTFHRFDRFNLKYNPAGQSRLREIFLKTDNVIGGRYLAEITKEVMSDLEASKYSFAEWRISIYGRKPSEWDLLSRWFHVHKLAHNNVRWLIQIPRLYHVYKKAGEVNCFEDMLYNIFAPLYQVSIDPSSNPALHYFLQTIVAFDSVDDESRPEGSQLVANMPKPNEWNSDKEPPYAYWMYYLYANICSLNQFRASRNLCTFQLRPHCGEAGDLDHLIAAYLVAHQINHGILLRKLPSLQYLYYLSQIGIAISPLSNNKLFLDYNKNPFPKYFSQGMNVSLSTDDPLMLHYTKDALVEEYSVAAQVWKLSSTDQNEIARNSVLQSGWELHFKKHFLGESMQDITMTNVPLIRLRYRQETLQSAIEDLFSNAGKESDGIPGGSGKHAPKPGASMGKSVLNVPPPVKPPAPPAAAGLGVVLKHSPVYIIGNIAK